MDLFDAHCHLASGPTADSSQSDVAVAGRLLCGTGPDDWDSLAEATRAWPGAVAAFGLHPWHCGKPLPVDWLDRLEKKLTGDPKAWVGECGLDGLKSDEIPADRQEEVFRSQLRLAARLRRPLNLHCVKAWDALVRLLDAEYLSGGTGRKFIVHSFRGPHQYIAPLRERGAYFTVGPLFARRDSPRTRRRCLALPEDRLLLESDAFLPPGADAGEDLRHCLDWLARIRTQNPAELADIIDQNIRRLFDHD